LATLDDEISRLAAAVRLIVVDSDGVLTDGRITMSSDGSETRSFNVTDGLGIRLAQKVGLLFGVISGRRSEVLARRAAELELDEIHQGIHDKAGCMTEILERRGLAPEAVCFVGDDLIDLPAMRMVGLAAAPADARPEVREAADFVTPSDGGRGSVRDVIDLVLRARGKWDEATARYYR
jgi:3-deoxy-D-manno-octulosonate 8-phosphate phosphatase (KDO 8-P phosphatase)